MTRSKIIQIAYAVGLSFLCSIFTPTWLYGAAEHPLQYARRVWRVQDGLPEDTVQALAETKDGYLWIGTTGGLTRFDGTRFLLNGSNTLSSPGVNSIFCLLASRDGSLWVGTEGGGLLHLQNGTAKHFGRSEGLTDGFVRSVLQDHQGTIWIGTDNGLFRMDGEEVRRVEKADAMGPLAVHGISEDSSGRIWVGGSKLLSIAGGSIRFYGLPGLYSSNRVKTVVQTTDGRVWVGTVSGLERLVGDHFESVPEVQGTVRTMKQTSDGTLWIGTIGNGLWTYKDGLFSHPSTLLPSNTVLKIFEDSSHQVWIGIQGGLVRLTRTPVRVVPLPHGSDADFETISGGGGDKSLWVVAAGVYKLRNGVAQPFHFEALPHVMARTIFHDREGDVWVGTDGSGAYRMTTHGVMHYSAPRELTNNFIRAFLETRDGDIWIATDEGVSRLTKQGVQRLTMNDGLVYFSIRSMLEDSAGDIWIGTDQGLSHWHESSFIRDEATKALQNEKIWSIYEDPTHTLWFGTRDHGLFRYSNGRIVRFTQAQGLASNSIYQILEDPQRRIWLSGPHTLSSLDERQMHRQSIYDEHLSVSTYAMPYGAEGAQMYGGRQPSGYLDADGSVWFPSSKGAIQVRLESAAAPVVPRVILEAVTLDGRTLPAAETLKLPSTMARLEFNYAPLSLKPQDGIRYQYKLEGLDKDWVYAGGNLAASYTNLAAGHYRFRVRAFDVDDPALMTEAHMDIQRVPFFWQTWWFLTLGVSLLLMMAWAIYQLRMHQVRLRFSAVLDERGRLAREMHDTVIQGCTSVSALLEAVASMKTEDGVLEKELLQHARTQVRATIDEARSAVWNLRHDDGVAVDLETSIEAIGAQTSKDFGVAVKKIVQGAAFALPGAISRELLMVVREAIYNAVQHAKPRTIVVTIQYEAATLRLLVKDDGRGFLAEKRPGPGHYGITGMRERMERLGGQLALQSVQGKGTEVELTIDRVFLREHTAYGRGWTMS